MDSPLASGSVVISLSKTLGFSQLSGDWNPVHTDPVTARRTLFGGTVVHGVHATLACIEQLFANQGLRRALSVIQVTYSGSLSHDEEARLTIETNDAGATVVRLTAGSRQIQTLSLGWEAEPVPPVAQPGNEAPPKEAPDVLDPETIAKVQGEVAALVDRQLAAELFPALVDNLPLEQLAAMLATTRIVGMRCPGMHSILSGLKLAFPTTESGKPLSYDVRRYSAPANFLTLNLQGSGAKGEVSAFVRPPPVEQPTYADLCKLVPAEQLAGRCALIVGGSRGLGEICAKLLAAAGAKVILTWHTGESDAARIVSDISEAGGDAMAIRWDCKDPPSKILDHVADAAPTHVYFFATSRIELNRSGDFDRRLFDSFIDQYVIGLERTVAAVRSLWPHSQIRYLFVPSTIFLDQPNPSAREYTAAKAAAEATARVIATEVNPEMIVQMPRLPRVLTDQTSSLANVDALSAVDVLLREII